MKFLCTDCGERPWGRRCEGCGARMCSLCHLNAPAGRCRECRLAIGEHAANAMRGFNEYLECAEYLGKCAGEFFAEVTREAVKESVTP